MKIQNYREINSGLMVSGFDVVIEEWGVTFKKCTLFRNGEKEFISFPSNKFVDNHGNIKYSPYIFMEKDKKARFDAKVIEMLHKGEYELANKSQQLEMPIKAHAFDEECPF